MDLTIDKSALLEPLALAQGVVDKRATIPVLANVLIAASKDGVEISATDQEIGLRARVDAARAKVANAGRVCVPARKLFEIIRECPDGDVLLRAQENNWITVHAGKAKFRLVGFDHREFPEMPAAPATQASIPVEALRHAVECTAFVMSVDDTRPSLCGIFIDVGAKDRLTVVATDGHRLVKAEIKEAHAMSGAGAIVPRKGVGEIRKIVDSASDGAVEISIDEGIAFFRRDHVELSVRLVEGEFPDYLQVLPEKPGQVAYVEAGFLTAPLRRLVTIASGRTHGVKFEMAANRLQLSTTNPDFGEADEGVEVDYAGPAVSVGFNARYLLDALAVLDAGARVEMWLADELSPAVLRREGDDEWLAIVMPMRL